MIDPDRFGETVGANGGAPEKVFTDMKEALTWLEV
jgi:hypothetical protein